MGSCASTVPGAECTVVMGQVGFPRLEEIQARLSLSDIDRCQSQAQQALVGQTLLRPLEDTASVSQL